MNKSDLVYEIVSGVGYKIENIYQQRYKILDEDEKINNSIFC